MSRKILYQELIERLEYVDYFLSIQENYLHGEEGSECNECRFKLTEVMMELEGLGSGKIEYNDVEE